MFFSYEMNFIKGTRENAAVGSWQWAVGSGQWAVGSWLAALTFTGQLAYYQKQLKPIQLNSPSLT